MDFINGSMELNNTIQLISTSSLIGAIAGSVASNIFTILNNKSKRKRYRKLIKNTLEEIKINSISYIEICKENNNYTNTSQKSPILMTSIDLGLINNTDLQIAAELSAKEISYIRSIHIFSTYFEESGKNIKDYVLNSETKSSFYWKPENIRQSQHAAHIIYYCELMLEKNKENLLTSRTTEELEANIESVLKSIESKYNVEVLRD